MLCCVLRCVSSPDGSYTEDNTAELHLKSRSSEFDDDFDEDEPLPSIGTCKALYPFQGTPLSQMPDPPPRHAAASPNTAADASACSLALWDGTPNLSRKEGSLSLCYSSRLLS